MEQPTKPADAPAPAVPDGLAQLAAEARALEAPADAGPVDAGQAVQEPAQSAAAELHGALTMARLFVAPMFGWWPEFETTWSDATLRGIADAGAVVMQRHGWTMGGVLDQYGPYVALAGATLPPALVTWRAIRERRELETRQRRAAVMPAAPGGEGGQHGSTSSP